MNYGKLGIMFIIVFGIIYLLYLVTVVLNKKKVNKILDSNQALVFINLNKLDKSKINCKSFANIIALSNSFIVASSFCIVEFFDNWILKLIVCFVVLIVLIVLVYKIVGYFMNKKEGI